MDWILPRLGAESRWDKLRVIKTFTCKTLTFDYRTFPKFSFYSMSAASRQVETVPELITIRFPL